MKKINREPEGFTRFWSEYGYKIGKKECLKIWARDCLEDLTNEICASIPAYDAHLQANPWKHKKHPSTFLRGAHWEDEFPVPTIERPDSLIGAMQATGFGYGKPRNTDGRGASDSGDARQLAVTTRH
jgi:hypothetical protein